MKTISYRIAIFLVVLSLLTGPVAPVFAQEGTPDATIEPVAEEETPTVIPTETSLPVETIVPTEPVTATETPSPSVTETIPVTPIVEVVETAPILLLTTDPAFLTRAETVNLFWSLEGISLETKSLVLQVSLPEGFTADKAAGTFDQKTRILNIPVTSLEGSVALAVKKVSSDSIFTARVLINEKETLATAAIILPLFEQVEVSKGGGKIDILEGKVKVTFPDGALQEDVLINAGFPSADTLPENYSAHVFELRAFSKEENKENTKQEETEIKHFDQPLTIEVDYSDLTLTEEQEQQLYLYWYNEKTGDWNALESSHNAETKTLTAKSDHFTVFDIGVNDWKATRLPNIDSFQVSQFTGAATYSLPIEVPPGPGGFQPNITLSYNSQVVDQATTKAQASWVGMGWSLDGGGSISVDGSTDGYQLEVNGVSTLLHQEVSGGDYHAVDENFWKIVHVENTTDNYWKVFDTKGSQYFFETNAVSDNGTPYKWYLTRVVDPFGQEMTYTYFLQTKNVFGVITTTAAYPNTITYSHSRYRVRFNRVARTDYTLAWDTDAAFHLYEKSRLNSIFVEQDSNGDGTFETIIRRYKFTYADPAVDVEDNIVWPSVSYSAGGVTNTLRYIEQANAGYTEVLPIHTFNYDKLHLVSATNGYGGGVQFTYDDVPWYSTDTPSSYVVTDSACPGWNHPSETTCNATTGQKTVVNGSTSNNILKTSTVNLIRPGGIYELTFTGSKTSGSTIQVGMTLNSTNTYNQLGPNNQFSHIVQLYRVANSPRPVFLAAGTGKFTTLTVRLLPSFYRVQEKTITDGNGHSYLYNYEYANPAIGNVDYEFRGHKYVTEIAPNGITTVTEYYQDDARKGQEKVITVTDASAVTIQRTINDYQYASLPEYPVNWRFVHAWVYLASQVKEVYNTSGALVGGTKTKYTYESSYGNLIKTEEYEDPTGTGPVYRTTDTEYHPKDNSTTYITSLPARQVVTGGSTVLSEVLYYYGGTNNNLAAPYINKLTRVRTLVELGSTNKYAQVDYGYDAYGNKTSVINYSGYSDGSSVPSGAVTTMTTAYDGTYHTYPLTMTNALSQPTTLTYDYTLGVPLTRTDPNGAVTKADYDTFGRIIGIHKPNPNAAGYETNASLTMSYTNSYPFTTTVTQVDTGYSVIQEHDGMGRVIKVNAGGVITDTIYDTAWVTKQSVPYEGASLGLFTVTTVDPAARTTTVLAPDGTDTITFTNGLVITFTDARGNATTTTTDVWGRTTDILPPTGPIIEYGYDPLGNLLTVDRGGVTTTLDYNKAGQKISMDDPDMGDWSYIYDALGNLKTQTDARTCLLTMDYDSLNRLTNKNSSGTCGTQVSTTYTYDAGTNGLGRRTGMIDASGSSAWAYDKRGRLTQETKTIGSVNYVTGWGYDNADLNTTITYPGGEVVTNSYNARMLLNSVTSPLANYVISTTYDSVGRIDQRALGNSLTQNFDYYAWNVQGGRLQTLVTGSLQDIDYQYDANGNIETLDFATVTAGVPNTESNTYEYDALDRLTDWTVDSGTPQTYEYEYDLDTGNLIEKENVDLDYNDTNHEHAVTHINNVQKYWYDDNGNQITRVIGADTFNLVYDAENRLVEVKKNSAPIATFTYDGDGKRISSTENSVTTLFIGNHYEVTNPGSGQTVTKYYFAGASRIAMRKYTIPSSMSVEYLLGDHLGSTGITTDNTGVKVSEMRYTPWGEVRSHWKAAQTTTPAYSLADYTFTGQYSYMDDPSTSGVTEGFGLMFYNARMYDPALGRFTSADSILPQSQGVQAYDRYAYVSNNPVKYTDPTGHAVSCGEPGSCGGGGNPNPSPNPDPNPEPDDGPDDGSDDDSPNDGGVFECSESACEIYIPNDALLLEDIDYYFDLAYWGTIAEYALVGLAIGYIPGALLGGVVGWFEASVIDDIRNEIHEAADSGNPLVITQPKEGTFGLVVDGGDKSGVLVNTPVALVVLDSFLTFTIGKMIGINF